MRGIAKDAIVAWGSGFVTASTFGAVMPASSHISVPHGPRVEPCSVVKNVESMEKTVRKVAAKNRRLLIMSQAEISRRELVLKRVKEVRNRLETVKKSEPFTV